MGKKQKDIHRRAAELKREIPPIKGTVIYKESQAVLFPDFRYKHKNPAEEKERAKANGTMETDVGKSAHKKNSLFSK